MDIFVYFIVTGLDSIGLSEDVDTELSFTVGYNHIFNTIMGVGTEYQLNRGMTVAGEDGAVEINFYK